MRPDGVRASFGVLDRIVEAKNKRLERAKLTRALPQLKEAKPITRSKIGFHDALKRKDRINIIAEIKHRSPSKGIIREGFDPEMIALEYRQGGAAAISILTEEDFFGGSLEYLRKIRLLVDDVPLLRKDFIFDEYQVFESSEAGADAVLLIASILSDDLLDRLLILANELQIDCLVEVHTAEEMSRASNCGARIIGVNNRDLASFDVDLDTSLRMAEMAPDGIVLVSESGIKTAEDINKLREAGFSAFLIGELFMRADHPGLELAGLCPRA